MNNPELRQELEKICRQNTGEKVDNQIGLIKNLKKKYPHSIEHMKRVKEGPANVLKSNYDACFNCFMYCFDLTYENIKDIEDIAFILKSFTDYISYLINNLLCKIARVETEDGDYVIYFSNKQPKHAGKLKSGKVESQWGHAHIWRHELCEVPISYGNEVKYFQKTTKHLCISALKQWAERKQKEEI